MNMKKILVSLFAGLVGATMLTVASLAAEYTVTDKNELQTVINNANNGDTVLVTVDPGAFTINKPITIKGVGEVALNDYQYISIAEGIDGKVKIENIDFKGTTNHIFVLNGSDFDGLELTISDCYIEYNANRGIVVDKELKSLTVSGCTIDNKATGYVGTYAIWTNPTAPAEMNITGNTILGNGGLRGAVHVGDYATNGSEITISGNVISGVERGVQVANQSEDVIIDIANNEFSDIKLCEGSSKTAEECAVIFLHANAKNVIEVNVEGNTATNTNALIYNENEKASDEFIEVFVSNKLNDEFVDKAGETYVPVAKIGEKYYVTLQDAISYAEANDTIFIFAGKYDAFTVPADKNGLTFVGETDADGNNLVTIIALEDDIETKTKGIYVQAEKATFKNLNVESGSALVKWCCSALGATNNSVGLEHSNLNDLTIENCNFNGNGSKLAVWARACDITIINSTFDGYSYAVETYATGADQIVSISNSEITNTRSAVHTSGTVAGSQIIVEDSVISDAGFSVSAEGSMTIEGSVLNNVDVAAYQKLSVTITDSALYDSAVYAVHDTSSVKLEKVFVNNLNEISAAAEAENITFTTYYPTEEDFESKTNLKEVPDVADAIYVEFVKADVDASNNDTDEQADLYNINLVAKEEIINRLNSVDLTFVLTQSLDDDGNAIGKNEFEIVASNGEIAINSVNNSTNRYEFHYDGKDNATTDTADTITIGQVKFTGYGMYNFAVDASANTNVAHATTLGDNIVDTFIPNDDETTVADGELVINDDIITDVLIAVPTRDLEIVIDFPNAVKADNNYKYQDMKVVVSGGELAEAIVIDLGADAVMPNLVTEVKTKAKAEVAVTDKYVVTLTGVLEVNNAYNVEVSGAGYRTAKYTVTMTDDKTLNFWNNVKDNAIEVEEGKDTSKKNITFLAGDIVKDSVINIYDLSAVVSYFGEIDLDEDNKPEYAKYDLNRDGKIDSKDVAYVLVSWGK